MAGVLEYLAAEVLELSGNAAKENKRARIVPRHIMLAIRNDPELEQLIGNATISDGGVMPNINPLLLPNNSKKMQKHSVIETNSENFETTSENFETTSET